MAGGCDPAPCTLVYCQIPPPTLVGYSILSILVFKCREIYLHMAMSSLCHLPCWECWDPSDPSDMGDIDEAINNGLLSLLNLQSREGYGN